MSMAIVDTKSINFFITRAHNSCFQRETGCVRFFWEVLTRRSIVWMSGELVQLDHLPTMAGRTDMGRAAKMKVRGVV